jgi:hypothetical protein
MSPSSPDFTVPASPVLYRDDLAQNNFRQGFQRGAEVAAVEVSASQKGEGDPIKLYDPITKKLIGTFVFNQDGTWDVTPDKGYTFETLAQALNNISDRYPKFKGMTAETLRYRSGLLHSNVPQPFDGAWGLRIQNTEYVYQWDTPNSSKPNVTLASGNYAVRVTDAGNVSVKPPFTPDVAAQELKAIGAELKFYLSGLSQDDQVRFWDAYRYYATGKAPNNYNVAVRSSTYVHPSAGGSGDTGQYVPDDNAITRQAAAFQGKYRALQDRKSVV